MKVNPIATWTDDDVAAYIDDHDVPVNPLLAPGLRVDRLRALHPSRRRRRSRAGRWAGRTRPSAASTSESADRVPSRSCLERPEAERPVAVRPACRPGCWCSGWRTPTASCTPRSSSGWPRRAASPATSSAAACAGWWPRGSFTREGSGRTARYLPTEAGHPGPGHVPRAHPPRLRPGPRRPGLGPPLAPGRLRHPRGEAGRPRRPARPPARPPGRRRAQRPLRLAPPVGGRGRRASVDELGVARGP